MVQPLYNVFFILEEMFWLVSVSSFPLSEITSFACQPCILFSMGKLQGSENDTNSTSLKVPELKNDIKSLYPQKVNK